MTKEPPSRTERVWVRKGVWLAVVGHPMGWRTGYARVPDDHPLRRHVDPGAVDRVTKYAQPETWENPEHPLSNPEHMAKFYQDPRNAEGVVLTDTWGYQIDVHGGITYAHEITEQAQLDGLLPGADGAPLGLWIGFDCAHAGDMLDEQLVLDLTDQGPMQDSYLDHVRRVNEIHVKYPKGWERSWTTEDVAAECESMADQLAAGKLFEQVKEVANQVE